MKRGEPKAGRAEHGGSSRSSARAGTPTAGADTERTEVSASREEAAFALVEHRLWKKLRTAYLTEATLRVSLHEGMAQVWRRTFSHGHTLPSWAKGYPEDATIEIDADALTRTEGLEDRAGRADTRLKIDVQAGARCSVHAITRTDRAVTVVLDGPGDGDAVTHGAGSGGAARFGNGQGHAVLSLTATGKAVRGGNGDGDAILANCGRTTTAERRGDGRGEARVRRTRWKTHAGTTKRQKAGGA